MRDMDSVDMFAETPDKNMKEAEVTEEAAQEVVKAGIEELPDTEEFLSGLGEEATSTQQVAAATEVPGEALEDGQVFSDAPAYTSDEGEALEDGGTADGEALDVNIDILSNVVETAGEVSAVASNSQEESGSSRSSSRRSTRRRKAASLDPGKDLGPRDKVQMTRNVFQFSDDEEGGGEAGSREAAILSPERPEVSVAMRSGETPVSSSPRGGYEAGLRAGEGEVGQAGGTKNRIKKKCLSRYPVKKTVWRKDKSRVEEEGARVLGVGRNRKQVNYFLFLLM